MICPASRRAKSSRPLIIRVNRSALRSMRRRDAIAFSGKGPPTPASKLLAYPFMAVKGVLRSCETVATNVDLSWSSSRSF
jgi:hypothetical protein